MEPMASRIYTQPMNSKVGALMALNTRMTVCELGAIFDAWEWTESCESKPYAAR